LKSQDLLGSRTSANIRDFSESYDLDDHKIRFVVPYCRGKDVLDIGCIQHNPENYRSKYWVHGALRQVAKSLVGLDLYEEGVQYLHKLGYNVVTADAQGFSLNLTFDVIVAGDVIEHLENFDGFIESCKRHLRPGGRLLISTPNPWYWRYVVKSALFKRVQSNPEHTCWLCPVTLAQLLARHGMRVVEVAFGSRYLRDRLMPLPGGLRHTSFHAECQFVESAHRSIDSVKQ